MPKLVRVATKGDWHVYGTDENTSTNTERSKSFGDSVTPLKLT